MKRIDMRIALRVWFGLLALVVAVSLMCTGVAATPAMEKQEAVEGENYVYWTMDDNGTRLQGDGVIYERYELPVGYKFDPSMIYVFANTCNDMTHYYVEINGLSRRSAVVWTSYDETLYVTAEGRAALDAFVGGQTTYDRLRDAQSERLGDLSEEFMADLAASAASNADRAASYDVTTLSNAERYDITAWDVYDSVYVVEGALYAMEDGSYGYVDYRKLDNSYFDANGDFSYRRGTVDLIPLEGEMAEAVERAVDKLSWRYTHWIYEEDEYWDPSPVGNELASATVAVIFSGILLPIAPFIVGLALPHSKKLGYPKRWYILSAVSLVWFVVGAVRLVLLLA